jgi:pyruvate dehydrogenase E1 component alpha subunit
MTSTHRGHGHTIAKGASMDAMMCELFGRASGCNGGKGGSMHIADFSVGMLGRTAWWRQASRSRSALRMRSRCAAKTPSLRASSATARSIAGRSWKASTGLRFTACASCSSARTTAGRRPPATDAMTAGDGALARARAIGVPGEQVDGNDVFAVGAAAHRQLEYVRSGAGPRVLHAITYRVKGHVSVDRRRTGMAKRWIARSRAIRFRPRSSACFRWVRKRRNSTRFARKPKSR